eukprot:scaffold636528_cov20-Prasinocladus_malaysianus.AAC.1
MSRYVANTLATATLANYVVLDDNARFRVCEAYSGLIYHITPVSRAHCWLCRAWRSDVCAPSTVYGRPAPFWLL